MSQTKQIFYPNIVGFERRKARQEQGGTPIHRPGASIRKKTDLKKLTIKSDWFKGGLKPDVGKFSKDTWGNKKIPTNSMGVPGCARDPAIAPMFVPRTPHGALLKSLKEIEMRINSTGLRRVKLVEEGGLTLADQLVKSNPFSSPTCNRGNCQVCLFKGSRGQCQSRSVTYSNTCLKCSEKGESFKYWGESSESLYERSSTHMMRPRKVIRTATSITIFRSITKKKTSTLKNLLSLK